MTHNLFENLKECSVILGKGFENFCRNAQINKSDNVIFSEERNQWLFESKGRNQYESKRLFNFGNTE